MKKIRIGHIGTMHDHSTGKMMCARRYPEVFEVVGIVPESKERWEEIKDIPCYQGIPCMTEDELFEKGVDAVIAEGHELELVNIAARAIGRGVHVHMDKPAGIDLSVFETLMREAESKNLTVQLAYMYRYNPEVKKILDMIRSGELGKVYSVEAHMNCDHQPAKRQWLEQFPGGMMYFLGCHLIDLIVLMQGIPNEVIPLSTSTGFYDVTAQDFGMAVLRYDSGVSFAKTCASEIAGYLRRQLVVCAEKGTIELKPFEVAHNDEMIHTESAWAISKNDFNWGLTGEKRISETFGRYDALLLDFAAMVRGEKTNPFTYDYEINVHKVILEACGIKNI